MMSFKKIFLITFFLGFILSVCGSDNTDPVVVTVAGKEYTRSQFEYIFNKNSSGTLVTDNKAILDYAEMFVNYKLKVQAALDNKLDTASSFIDEFRKYRDAQLKPYVNDNGYIDSMALSIYENAKKAVGDSDVILVSHIFLPLSQKASIQQQGLLKLKIDSIYLRVLKGDDFGELAKKYSQDRQSAKKGGELPWMGPNSSLPEFTAEAYRLKKGEVSKPFLSTAGYHIILMKDRHPFESYEEKKAEIVKMLILSGASEQSLESGISKRIAKSGGKLTREQVMQEVLNEASMDNPELNNLIQEYYDGLLTYEANDKLVWRKASADTVGLESYYNKNKKQFRWDAPRFRGFVVSSSSSSHIDQVKKALVNCKSKKEGESAVKKAVGTPSKRHFMMRFGVFKEGAEAHVDAKIFGKAEPKPNKMMPYYDVVGKLLDQPETYKDDLQVVISAYQAYMEKEWIKELRKKYPFSIDKKTILTVNKH